MDAIYRPNIIPAFRELRGGQVLLRNWIYRDLPCIEQASRDPVIPINTTVPKPFSEERGRAFVKRQWERQISGEGVSLAVVEAGTGTAIGLMVLLHRQQPGVVGVGYWTVADYRRRGITRTALLTLSRWALSLPDIARLEALVEPGNDDSRRVLERAGFKCEGLLREYFNFGTPRHDALLYSLVTDDMQPLISKQPNATS